MDNDNRYIYHFTEHETYERSMSQGFYKPVNFEIDGFIHCSTREQVLRIANRIASKTDHLVLLKLDTERIQAKIVYENLEGGDELFPHVYGVISRTVISEAEPFYTDAKGNFELPDGY